MRGSTGPTFIISAVPRLTREAPAGKQAFRAITLGLLLAALGGGMLALLRVVAAGSTDWIVSVVGGGFLLVGVITLVLGLRMSLMARVPETIVEVDRLPIRAGVPFEITLRQPGPIRLKSLRLNIVGEQVTTRRVWRRGKTERDVDRRLIHQHNVIDVRDVVVSDGAEAVHRAETCVPAAVTWADVEGTKTLVWRIEVWGRVRGGVDFGHPFVIEVRGGSQPPREEREQLD